MRDYFTSYHAMENAIALRQITAYRDKIRREKLQRDSENARYQPMYITDIPRSGETYPEIPQDIQIDSSNWTEYLMDMR